MRVTLGPAGRTVLVRRSPDPATGRRQVRTGRASGAATIRLLLAALALAGACASVPVAAQTTIKIGYATAATSHYGVGSTAFCDDLEKRTSGRYKCQVFANSALGVNGTFIHIGIAQGR